MSALRRIKKVKGGYEVTVSCSNKPTLTAFYRTYEQCGKFADDYFLDYLGVELKSVHHPVGDGVVPEDVNPDSLETMEIEIPMNERLKELAFESGFTVTPCGIWESEDTNIERFAQLVRDDERDKCASDYLQDCCDAIAAAEHNEREACAKLCEEVGEKAKDNDGYTIGGYACAKAIRARGEK